MRKAVFAVLAVLCSVGTAEEVIENQVQAQNEPETSLISQCGGGRSARTARGRRRDSEETKGQDVARCGRRRNSEKTDETKDVLAGKCKGGNCNRGRGSHAVA
jgi:hypothetical protein